MVFRSDFRRSARNIFTAIMAVHICSLTGASRTEGSSVQRLMVLLFFRSRYENEQMADKPKSVACVRDLRDAPLEEFRLPDDSQRQWKQVARNRQALANFLATYADGDGSRVYPSIATMMLHFGWSKATNCRLLKDLETLGLQKKVGLQGKQGTARRQIQVDAFRLRFSESQTQFQGVSGSVFKESQTPVKESQAPVKESQAQLKESHPDETQPPLLTATETATSTATNSQTVQAGGWRLLQEKYMAEIGYFGRKAADFQKHIDDYGFDIVDAATKAALEDGNFGDAKFMAGIVLHRLGQKLAAEVKIRHRAAQQKKQDEIQAASIERQTQEIIARRDARPAVSEVSMEDFLEGIEKENKNPNGK
jgi:hypothetical protein